MTAGRDDQTPDSNGGTRSAPGDDESDEELTEEAMVTRKGCGCIVNHIAALVAVQFSAMAFFGLELQQAEFGASSLEN